MTPHLLLISFLGSASKFLTPRFGRVSLPLSHNLLLESATATGLLLNMVRINLNSGTIQKNKRPYLPKKKGQPRLLPYISPLLLNVFQDATNALSGVYIATNHSQPAQNVSQRALDAVGMASDLDSRQMLAKVRKHPSYIQLNTTRFIKLDPPITRGPLALKTSLLYLFPITKARVSSRSSQERWLLAYKRPIWLCRMPITMLAEKLMMLLLGLT